MEQLVIATSNADAVPRERTGASGAGTPQVAVAPVTQRVHVRAKHLGASANTGFLPGVPHVRRYASAALVESAGGTARAVVRPKQQRTPCQPWDDFLARLDGAYASPTREFWAKVVRELPDINLPRAGATPDGGLQMVWEDSQYHLAIDIYPDHAEWFAAVIATNETSSDDFEIDEKLPRELVFRLRRFSGT